MSKVTTKTEVRLSYTSLLAPRAVNEGDDPVYSTSILIPKSDTETVKAIKAAITEALTEGVAKKFGGKMPPKDKLRYPLRDGDTEKKDKDDNPDENYAGMWFINAKGPRGGQEKPVLLAKGGKATTSDGDIYSGVWGRASLQFYAYDTKGNKGIACGLSAFISEGHGEALGNQVTESSARAEFGVTTPDDDAAAEFAGGGTAAASEAPASSDADSDPDPWA